MSTRDIWWTILKALATNSYRTVGRSEDTLDLWLIQGAERFRHDPPVSRALLNLAKHKDSRSCLVLMEAIFETPELAEKLLHVLRPQQQKMRDRNKPGIG